MEVYSALWNYGVSCGIIESLVELYESIGMNDNYITRKEEEERGKGEEDDEEGKKKERRR